MSGDVGQCAVNGIRHGDCRVLSDGVGEGLSDGFRSKLCDRAGRQVSRSVCDCAGKIVDDGLSDCIRQCNSGNHISDRCRLDIGNGDRSPIVVRGGDGYVASLRR